MVPSDPPSGLVEEAIGTLSPPRRHGEGIGEDPCPRGQHNDRVTDTASTTPTAITTGTGYDVARVRSHFPQLREGEGRGAAHFDGPGGSQTPEVVARAVYDTLVNPLANADSVTPAERNASRAVAEARAAIADLLNADPRAVVFGRSMTQLTMDLARTLAQAWGPGDEVVVTRLDHDSNVRSWTIAAERAGATVRWVDFDPETGELDPARVAEVLTERTRVVAITAASNLIGTRPDIPAIAELTHRAGALLHVDGVHYAAHVAVDMTALGADSFVCSPYKFLGPHCGVLAARPEVLEALRPDKLVPASDLVPERFELGTPAYELLAGTSAAVDFLADLVPTAGSRRDRIVASYAALEAHEDRLRETIEEALAGLSGVRLHARARRRTPTLLMTFADHDPQDVRRHLASRNVNAPAGSFYAHEASLRLGLGTAGGLRIGLAPYTDDRDVDRLLEGLREYIGDA
jgi:cysteine desulfurase family protein (TIGR01976 family)